MDTKEKIETISCELLRICAEKGLSINEMFELSRVFPKKIREQIDLLESSTKFTTDFDSNIQE
ncbi:hypothetical protein LIR45_01460 [Lachnospiraceae bacterium EP-SM-12S-S03]|nr:hypothetical protein [Lachnospiraceae bacterium EP-SM-12S-S03]